MQEIWKDIQGYEGLYQVSNFGNVRSLKYNHTKEIKLLKPQTTPKGYLWVCLKGKKVMVHRIVANTFISNLDNKTQVNHINGDKTDNRKENLEWCTNSENQLHAYKLGLQTRTRTKRTDTE